MRSRRRSGGTLPASVVPCDKQSKPLVLELKTWFEQQLAPVWGKSLIRNHYGLNHWDGLTHFLDNGRIELDTKMVERSIGPLVLNRKNALFAGHDQGAENWAYIASLIETCSCTGSIRKPTSPTCSPSSLISDPRRRSTSSCPGPGQPSARPINSRRDAPNRAAAPAKN